MRSHLPLRSLLPGLCVLAGLVGASPAGAVVGGEPLDVAQVPWYADLGCGGSLVAPDRVLTAAHCVGDAPLASLGVNVAGRARAIRGVALAPGWRHANGPHNYRDDVALLMLAEPVDDAPVADVGGPPAAAMKIIGRGYHNAPGSGRPEQENWDGALRQATLRTLSDRACAKAFRHERGNGGERFYGTRMICAIDPDGRAPLSSGCNGDSGGPLMAGTYDAPRVVGVVSYGGNGCGTDHLPSVFAEVERFRSFILAPNPVLAPAAPSGAAIRRSGRALTCVAPAFANGPVRVGYGWQRARHGLFKAAGRGRRHTITRADHARVLTCSAEASNAGGHATAVSTPLRIPR